MSSGIGLCDELITHPEEFYHLFCFVVCDLETSKMGRPYPALGLYFHLEEKVCKMLYICDAAHCGAVG